MRLFSIQDISWSATSQTQLGSVHPRLHLPGSLSRSNPVQQPIPNQLPGQYARNTYQFITLGSQVPTQSSMTFLEPNSGTMQQISLHDCEHAAYSTQCESKHYSLKTIMRPSLQHMTFEVQSMTDQRLQWATSCLSMQPPKFG